MPCHRLSIKKDNLLRLDKDDNIDNGIAHGKDCPEDTDCPGIPHVVGLIVEVVHFSMTVVGEGGSMMRVMRMKRDGSLVSIHGELI